MMKESNKVIIGIVAKHNPKNTGCEKTYITDATKQAIFDNGAIAIGILPTESAVNYKGNNNEWKDTLTEFQKNNLISQIKLCNGIILQGGLEMDNYEFIVAKYCYENNIPILGICAGGKMLIIVKCGVYKINKDEFFDIFKDYKLMENKECGNKRPCYFCFRDRKNKEIIWFVPISTKYDKYKKIYDNKKLKIGNKPVYNFVFGNVLGKKAVFLIQNVFPTTEEYILEKYTNSNIDVEIPVVVKNEIITTALRVVRLAEEGIHIPFYNIVEMRNILLKE